MSTVALHPAVVQRLFDQLPDLLRCERARGVNLMWHVELVGRVPARYTIEVANRTCAVRAQLFGKPDCHLITDASVFAALCEGRQSAELAALTGELKTDSMARVMKFQRLFCT